MDNRAQGQYVREYKRERLRMWEIIHIRTHSLVDVSRIREYIRQWK